jgi:diacylglycerol diphosphate phosphatase/phosphatidate phosphatase
VSFAGLGFLTFYLAGKLHLFDRRGHAVSSAIHSSLYVIPTLTRPFCQAKAWISLTPLAGASLVAISRSMDYRRKHHHPIHFVYRYIQCHVYSNPQITGKIS